MTSLRQRFIEDMQIRNLAVNTQFYYVQQVSRFARHFNKSPLLLGPEQIRAYQLYLTNERKLAPASILVTISTLSQDLQQFRGDLRSRPRERDLRSTL